jgi:hypothetical protein
MLWSSYPVAEFIDPLLEDKVNSGIGLSYQPASHVALSCLYDNPMPELTLSPSQEAIISATGYGYLYIQVPMNDLTTYKLILVFFLGKEDFRSRHIP